MKFKIYTCGKLKESPLQHLAQEYQGRITTPLEITEIDTRNKSATDTNKKLRELIGKPPILFALDERGKNFTSTEFAALLGRYQDEGQECAFVIGEADGLPDDIRQKATHLIAFGKATWPHLMVRVMLLEQLYRAECILKGHPYHRG